MAIFFKQCAYLSEGKSSKSSPPGLNSVRRGPLSVTVNPLSAKLKWWVWSRFHVKITSFCWSWGQLSPQKQSIPPWFHQARIYNVSSENCLTGWFLPGCHWLRWWSDAIKAKFRRMNPLFIWNIDQISVRLPVQLVCSAKLDASSIKKRFYWSRELPRGRF